MSAGVQTAEISVSDYPAKLLEGVVLSNGWHVAKRLSKDKVDANTLTPGFFSVGYEAQKNGEKAFLKAFDIGAVLQLQNIDSSDPTQMMHALQDLTSAFNSENALLSFCKESNLDRIVKVLDRGFAMPPVGLALANNFPVPYLLFELAEGDIRDSIGKADSIDDYLRLDYLHAAAVGLQQLHSNQICHQDLKPANVLVFEKEGVKLGDLGRASRRGNPAPHDAHQIPGDIRYAPPELDYGEQLSSWVDRREASDLYHLGSLVAFMFTGLAINTALYDELPHELRADVWRGRYEEVLPHLNAAFTRALAKIRPMFPEWACDDLSLMLSQMCTPDYKKRGAPDARAQAGNPIGLDRFISKLDVLRKRALVRAKKEK